MSRIKSSVEKAICDCNMLGFGDTVIVALSGGADSVSLLNILISLKEKYSIDIKAAHLNHNLRGEEALRDENFVRKICRENGVELFVKSLDIKKTAERDKIGEELAGR
ncbi:MAG: tRNA(Ile)-lysidine synthetase, partial [Ruminococcus sp.]|nr:tRNA(Ile)-lysidine synthetase [Ruminococcus sp.]